MKTTYHFENRQMLYAVVPMAAAAFGLLYAGIVLYAALVFVMAVLVGAMAVSRLVVPAVEMDENGLTVRTAPFKGRTAKWADVRSWEITTGERPAFVVRFRDGTATRTELEGIRRSERDELRQMVTGSAPGTGIAGSSAREGIVGELGLRSGQRLYVAADPNSVPETWAPQLDAVRTDQLGPDDAVLAVLDGSESSQRKLTECLGLSGPGPCWVAFSEGGADPATRVDMQSVSTSLAEMGWHPTGRRDLGDGWTLMGFQRA